MNSGLAKGLERHRSGTTAFHFRLCILLCTSFVLSSPALPQKDGPAPQRQDSALREAINDWVFAKDVSVFEKHLPRDLQEALKKAPLDRRDLVLQDLEQYLLIQRGFKLEKHGGSNPFVTAEDEENKYSATITKETIVGDKATFEVLVRRSQNGDEILRWGWPRMLVVRARQEDGIWRLSRIDFASMDGSEGLDADDPDLRYELIHGRDAMDERVAVRELKKIMSAEQKYAKANPDIGFTCNLADLGIQGSPLDRDVHHAGLIEGELAAGRSRGYRFELQRCGDLPSTTFGVVSSPRGAGSKRNFCADQENAVFSSNPGSPPSDCLDNRISFSDE